MYDDDFLELMKIKVISVHAITKKRSGLSADLSVIQFNRPTRSWYDFSYNQWNEIAKIGYW